MEIKVENLERIMGDLGQDGPKYWESRDGEHLAQEIVKALMML